MLASILLNHFVSIPGLSWSEGRKKNLLLLLSVDSLAVSVEQGGHRPGQWKTWNIQGDFSEYGKLREFSGNSVQPQGKIVTDKVFLVRHSNICVKQLLTG